MTNKELQDLLRQYPDDAPIQFNAYLKFGYLFENSKVVQMPIGRLKYDSPVIVLQEE